VQKQSSVNKKPELQAAKMVTRFDGKDCFPHTISYFLMSNKAKKTRKFSVAVLQQ
jgi:hypothetical protein